MSDYVGFLIVVGACILGRLTVGTLAVAVTGHPGFSLIVGGLFGGGPSVQWVLNQ